MANRLPSLKSPERPRQPDESIGAFLPGLEQYQTSSRVSETTSRNSSPTKTPLHDESIGAGTALPNQGLGDRHDISLTEPVAAPTEVQQRPAPKPKSGKKGTASAVQYSVKRRKIDGSGDGTPSVGRSGTLASSRASKTTAPKNRKQQSVTSDRSSSPIDPEEDDGEEDEDAALFCVCRKPDDHTVMIACDGPCQDWFHERCVGIDEKDGNLIDKYICPNCELNGNGQTTWKRMCRLETCRNPARVNNPKPSKYCSDAHGLEYMRRRHTGRDSEEARLNASYSTGNRKRRRDNDTDNFDNGDDNVGMPEDPNTQRGGVLRDLALKTLAIGVNNVAELRQLGEGVLSPSQTASPQNGEGDGTTNKHFNAPESQQLAEIASKKEKLEARKDMLEHRDRFLQLVESRAKRLLEELRKTETVKDICGYDSRLSWSDDEFLAWADSSEGQQALKSGVLTAATTAETIANGKIQNNGGEEDTAEVGSGVCQNRRCERHHNWYKLQQQDILFEKGEVRLAMSKLGREEEGVRKRAVVRRLEEG